MFLRDLAKEILRSTLKQSNVRFYITFRKGTKKEKKQTNKSCLGFLLQPLAFSSNQEVGKSRHLVLVQKRMFVLNRLQLAQLSFL